MRLKTLVLALIVLVLTSACAYIVLPEDLDTTSIDDKGWTGQVTGVSQTAAGDLHIDLALENETGDWSAMLAAAGKPALLTVKGGKTANCETVFANSGGHRLAPGFRMRGYTAGTKLAPVIQMLYVECKGVTASAGAKLSFDYSYVVGEFNYFDKEANKSSATLTLSLDQVAVDLTYPVARPVEGLILKPATPITALNDCQITLSGVARSTKGLEFKWQNANPGEYPTNVHIGNPPLIGDDGIIYGRYESPDLASAPVAGAGKTAEWSTSALVPDTVHGLVMLLSVESKKQRWFVNYAIDLTGL